MSDEIIDVLAVLDECIAAQNEVGANWAHEDLPTVRAAIAGLIEKAQRAEAKLQELRFSEDTEDEADDLSAALARAGATK